MARNLVFSHPDITQYPSTGLTANASALSSTLTVENGLQFSAGQFLLFDGLGNSSSEIVRIAGSAPTANTITLNSSYKNTFPHTIGATLQYIPYNQIAIEYSTNFETLFATGLYTIDEANAAATWSSLTTINITPANPSGTQYQDTSASTRSYRSRFYNSSTAVYSGYGDPILSSGYEEKSFAKIAEKAVRRMGQRIGYADTDLITEDFLIDEANNARRLYFDERRTWAANQKMTQNLSEITAGVQQYLLPTGIDIRETPMSTLNIYTKSRVPIEWVDKADFNYKMRDVVNTTLSANLTTGSTSIVLADTSDLPATGTLIVITGTTQDEVTWTANNKTTNTLTLAATSGVTVTHASGTNVWYGASFGEPKYYTIYDGYAHLYPIPSTAYHQQNLFIDYYQKLIETNSMNDYILDASPLYVMNYLCLAIAEKLDSFEDISIYERRVQEDMARMRRKEFSGQRKFLTPRLPYQQNSGQIIIS